MNDNHTNLLNEQVGAYVLDALPSDEAAEFEAHLASCLMCRREVAELREVVDVLPLSLTPMEPPSSLRDRISQAAEQDLVPKPALTALAGGTPKRSRGRRFSAAEGVLALAAVAVIAALGLWNVRLQTKVTEQQAAVSFQQLVSQALNHRDAVYPVSPTASAVGAAAYMIQPPGRRAAYLIVKDLPKPPSNKVYQMWLLRRGVPTSAGTFTYSGSNPKIVPVLVPARGYSVTAVTVENGPSGSSKGPTGDKVLVGSLGA